ncbi:MAG: hypothetical protein WC497_04575 [Patescibacteria group bacterium]
MKETGEPSWQPREGDVLKKAGNPSPETPHLPAWFREHQQDHYTAVLSEELELLRNDPDAYCADMRFGSGTYDSEGKEVFLSWSDIKERYGVTGEELRPIAEALDETLRQGFSFEKLGERANHLLTELPDALPNLASDFSSIAETIIRRTQRTVLKRMVQEYLPRRRVILHRGSFEPLRKRLFGASTEKVAEKLDQLGSLGLLAKFVLKDPAYRVEEIGENLQQGIGGFEFDVRLNKDGEPVVTHAHSKKALEQAPALATLLDTIRELLPADPHAPRNARRGLKLFLHFKVSSENSAAIRNILGALDTAGVTGHTYIQTGRPEALYAIDTAEKELSRQNPEREQVRFAFQTVPLFHLGRGAQQIGAVLQRLGLASRYSNDELRSLSGWMEEMHLLNEWPPKGRVMEILRGHTGSSLALAAAVYKKEMLQQAAAAGAGIHIGTFDKGTLVEDLLSPDAFHNRPKTVMTMNREVVFPTKEAPPEQP